MVDSNGKWKNFYIIMGTIILALSLASSIFGISYTYKVMATEFPEVKKQTTVNKASIVDCYNNLSNHIQVAEKNFELVDKDIFSLQTSDLRIEKLQEVQTETIGEQTKAITILTNETKNMKEAIQRLQDTK